MGATCVAAVASETPATAGLQAALGAQHSTMVVVGDGYRSERGGWKGGSERNEHARACGCAARPRCGGTYTDTSRWWRTWRGGGRSACQEPTEGATRSDAAPGGCPAGAHNHQRPARRQQPRRDVALREVDGRLVGARVWARRRDVHKLRQGMTAGGRSSSVVPPAPTSASRAPARSPAARNPAACPPTACCPLCDPSAGISVRIG